MRGTGASPELRNTMAMPEFFHSEATNTRGAITLEGKPSR